MADGFVVREAETEQDDEAVAGLMTEYLEWGHQRLSEEYGVSDPPGDPALVRQGLGQYRSPNGLLLIAECDGEVVLDPECAATLGVGVGATVWWIAR